MIPRLGRGCAATGSCTRRELRKCVVRAVPPARAKRPHATLLAWSHAFAGTVVGGRIPCFRCGMRSAYMHSLMRAPCIGTVVLARCRGLCSVGFDAALSSSHFADSPWRGSLSFARSCALAKLAVSGQVASGAGSLWSHRGASLGNWCRRIGKNSALLLSRQALRFQSKLWGQLGRSESTPPTTSSEVHNQTRGARHVACAIAPRPHDCQERGEPLGIDLPPPTIRDCVCPRILTS